MGDQLLSETVRYWDSLAGEKHFTHPIDLPLLRKSLNPASPILDYGCGYGRTCQELRQAGFQNVVGIDISGEMIARGLSLHPSLDLRRVSGRGPLDFADGRFAAVLLVSVLTCIASEAAQKQLVLELRRILAPGGLLFVSDLLLQEDSRNRDRYRRFADVLGGYGIFELEDGAVMRHHSREWIEEIVDTLECLHWKELDVTTMNGHAARAFQALWRAPTQPAGGG